MARKAFEKIAAGLNEAIDGARPRPLLAKDWEWLDGPEEELSPSPRPAGRRMADKPPQRRNSDR
jgi:hypothetical protein